MVKPANTPTANNHVVASGKEGTIAPTELPFVPLTGTVFSVEDLGRPDRRKPLG